MIPAKSFEATKVEDFKMIIVTSPAFKENESIPAKYTCDGSNDNPPLDLANIPEAAASLVLIVDDPDAPGGTWLHWLNWNIPITHHIREGHKSGIQGINDFKKRGYGGPCPPTGTHRYQFKVYALNNILKIENTANVNDVEKAMSDNIMAFGSLTGIYSRKK